MAGALKIGDQFVDGSLIVRDEDRLCYKVLSLTKGCTGICTISKALLEEWVSATREHPDYALNQLRSLLNGKTEIGDIQQHQEYAAIYKKMADMMLGNVEVVHSRPEYSFEFCKWFAENRGDGKDTTAKKYILYFKTLTDSYQEPTNSYWHGLYRVLYSHDAEKEVIEIGELAEFQHLYGDIISALETKVKSEGMTDEGFKKAIDWFWRPEVKPHTCVTSALKAYADFLKWRETQNKAVESSSSFVDRLTIALKLFADRRATERTGGSNWNSYDEWTHSVRKEFQFRKVNENLLDDKEFDYVKFMLKFSVSDQLRQFYINHSPDEQKAVLQFLKEQKESPRAASWYMDKKNRLQVNGKKVDGMRATTVLYFMSELHPEEFAAWSEPIWKGLCNVGLHNSSLPQNVTIEKYEDCRAKQQQIVARMKELGIGKASDDPSAPDYRTANEFLWWVQKKENRALVERGFLEGKMIAAKHEGITPDEKKKTPKHDKESKDDVLLLRLRAALRTKPFAILAGHSGTGKSRMVRELAYMTCNDAALRKDEKGNPAKDPGNFCMVQVKPNWHDSGDLLGYYSELGKRYRASDFVKFIVKAYAYPDTPFFVCLDEMNLAPVEQYFAEYLSAIESRKIQKIKVLKGDSLAEADIETVVSDELIPRSAYVEGEEANRIIHYDWLGCELKESEYWIANYGLTIPRNLFVVGTVNMDESTNQFSRKVLDRAMTLEMTDADFKSFGKKGVEPSYDDYMGDKAVADLLAGKTQAEKLEDDQIENLVDLKRVLGATSFAIAYRFANEYALYEKSLKSTQGLTDPATPSVPSVSNPALNDQNKQQGDGEEGSSDGLAQPDAFDDMILMKVLPRISGEDVAVRRIFFGEGGKFSYPKPGSLLWLLVKRGGGNTESCKKIKAIDERGGSYLSFWP